MMNAEQLQDYLKGIKADLKYDELALARVKTKISSAKRMVKIVEEQIKSLSENESVFSNGKE